MKIVPRCSVVRATEDPFILLTLQPLFLSIVTLMARFWSSLSDRIGRKRVLFIGSCGLFLSQAITLVVFYFRGVSLYIIWVSGIVEGLSGSVLTAVAITHAYAADVTVPEKRTVVFGRIMAAYYVGVGLG